MRNRLSLNQYVNGILSGDRLVLSQAITLIESQRADDQLLAQNVLSNILPQTGNSIRLGITGVPGVGKSTFIESFGTYLTKLGHKLAVLAVDPTSQRSKGSLMGDKTRMETLSTNPHAYIRPSPAGHTLGGVGRHTRETILLCEAAGFDIILVETVGVGQSETAVRSMVDFFLLLMLAGAGDELQGMKRGIMELADALVITKADGANQDAANRARIEYQNALHLFPPAETGWLTPVLTCSALTGEGMSTIWDTILNHQLLMTQNGYKVQYRQEQQLVWFKSLLRQYIDNWFYSKSTLYTYVKGLEDQIKSGTLLPIAAIQALQADER